MLEMLENTLFSERMSGKLLSSGPQSCPGHWRSEAEDLFLLYYTILYYTILYYDMLYAIK